MADDKKAESLYLPEDEDFLSELETQLSGHHREKDWILAKAQVKALLRNRKTLQESSKSTDKYSIVLMALTVIQIAIAILVFIFSVFDSRNPYRFWIGSLILLLMGALIFYIIKFFLRELDK